MPQEKNRRGEVLHWDQVFDQFATAAAAMPIEDINRDLAARGFDPGKLCGAVGKLGGCPGSRAAGRAAVPARTVGNGPLPLPLPLRMVEYGGGAPEPSAMRLWSARSAVAGMVGAAIVGLLALPVSGALVTHWSGGATVAKADKSGRPAGAPLKFAQASPPGTTTTSSRPGAAPDKAREVYYSSKEKTAMLRRCAAGNPDRVCAKGKATLAADSDAKKGKAAKSKPPEGHEFIVLASRRHSSSSAKI